MLKEDDFVGRMMEEEVYRELYDAVRRLPARCRDIFILKLDGADNRDIARRWYHRRNRARNCAGERTSGGS